MIFDSGDTGSSGVDTGDIGHSLRFRGGASAYLSRTFGTPSSTTKMLLSVWIRPADISSGFVNAGLISLANPSTSGIVICGTGAFGAGVQDRLLIRNGGANKDYWNLVFRDPTSWIHLVLSIDTTQATQADRAKLWVNGVEQTKASSALGASEAIGWNAAGTVTINGNLASYYGGYYGARHILLDNKCVQQGTASVSDFGYLNTEINEWVTKSQSAVKAVVDAGGTNSFMLDFDNGTSLTTLGYDKSSKGNNWTLNNFSLTAGTSYDWMLDVPGNSFATLNPLDPTVTLNGNTLSEGNLKLVTSAGNYNGGHATQGTSAGKVYFEVTLISYGAGMGVGMDFGNSTAGGAYPGSTSGSYAYRYDGLKGNNGSWTSYGASTADNDVIGVAYDADNGKLYFSKNGTWQNSGDPVAGTGFAFSGLSGTAFPHFGDLSGAVAATFNLNFGQAPLHASATYDSASGGYFRYTPPAGYKALCQRNMPDPAILNPETHFDVLLHAGNSSTQSVTSAQFQPDLVWIKGRNTGYDHHLFDAVRTLGNKLSSNLTDAEAASGLTAFNSNGFSMNGAFSGINGTGTNYVDWLWKAGGAPVTNNAGSISSQVSANVTAGFSIVSYTGTGANATVGHGLGKAPGLVIVKNRDNTGASWATWHSALAGSEALYLESTSAKVSLATAWNSTVPTSSVFSVGTSAYTNNNTQKHVAYCFAEIPGYSKIGSYTGNGSADGPFVHCGFKPKYVLVKRTDSTGGWYIMDAVRDTYNVEQHSLAAHSSAVEDAATAILDGVSNGFKLRTTFADVNANGGTYIFYAIADVAGKYSLGR